MTQTTTEPRAVLPCDRTRFWSKTKQCGPSDCWPWLGAHNGKNDRGRFWMAGRMVYATHASLQFDGRPRPDPHVLACHTCDNANCVNPDHLYWGTRTDNARDAIRDGKNRNARKTHCLRGHLLDEANARVRINGSRQCRECHRLRQREAV